MTLRSWLFLPADRPDRLEKARNSGADVVILDLEDAVAPASKERARAEVLAAIATPHPVPLAVRINPLDTPAGLADVLALISAPSLPAFVILPKTEYASQIVQLRRLLARTSDNCRLVALIESARGLTNAVAIATARPDFLAFGAADYAADIGATTDWAPMASARSRLVEAGAAEAVLLLDSPCFAIDAAEVVEAESRNARSMGFAGKLAIHPKQIAPINAAFTPNVDELAWARQVIEENRKGVGVIDGQLVDEAIARRARRILSAG